MINLPSTLGRAFIISALVPAFVFVLLNAAFVSGALPGIGALIILGDTPLLGALGIKSVDLTLLLIPSLIGVLLNALNTFIIRLFEGAHGFERAGIFKWLLERKVKQHTARMGDLRAFQDQFRKSSDDLEKRGLRIEIGKIQQRIYTGFADAGMTMPSDPARLLPTTFGNIWAAIEEYPYLRYGMDGTTFWPRMISVVPKEYAEMIADKKMTLDLLLNSSLLALVFGAEMLAVAAPRVGIGNTAFALGAFVAAYILYQTANVTLLEMGELINSCFDLFRGALGVQMGLKIPAGDIETERHIWSGVNSYILSGDSYYYPSEGQKSN